MCPLGLQNKCPVCRNKPSQMTSDETLQGERARGLTHARSFKHACNKIKREVDKLANLLLVDGRGTKPVYYRNNIFGICQWNN